VYEGRNAGVGRIVTGSTFHHYIDINLTGDSGVTGASLAKTGPTRRRDTASRIPAPRTGLDRAEHAAPALRERRAVQQHEQDWQFRT
jgi:hypothetical protein